LYKAPVPLGAITVRLTPVLVAVYPENPVYEFIEAANAVATVVCVAPSATEIVGHI